MKKTGIAVLLLTLAAFILRLYRIDLVSLRGDEAFTVVFVERTWDGLWKGIRTVEPNPPLMYLALRVWVAIAGASELVTRYFSAFFGVLCVPLIYRLGREMFSWAPAGSPATDGEAGTRTRGIVPAGANALALTAAALIAINPYQIWHSQDVRNYTLWPALSLGALVLFWRWWKAERMPADGRRRYLLLACYVLATLASLYTHYYDTFILLAVNVFVVGLAVLERRWSTLARWIGAQAALAAAYVPWVLWGTNRVTTYGEASAEQSIPLLDQFSRTVATFILSDTVPADLKTLVWVPAALALVGALAYLALRHRLQAAFLTLYIAVPTLALYAISIGRPLFLERYLNGIAPAYYLTFAVGLTVVGNWALGFRPPVRSGIGVLRWAAAALGVLFFFSASAYALSNYYFDPAYTKAPNWRALTQYINARRQPGDIVVQNFTEMAPIYYEAGALPVMTLPKDYWPAPGDDKTLQQLNQEYRRIWFIPASPDLWDPNHHVETYLSRFDERLMDTSIAEFGLQLYATPAEFVSQIIPSNARIGNAVLAGYRIQGLQGAVQVERGATLPIVLYWRTAGGEDKIEHDLSVYVHLIDAGGRTAAQQEGPPADGSYPMTQWQSGDLIVDAHPLKVDVAPGTYSLVAGMYDPGAAASAADPSGGLPGEPLTQVTVVP